MLKKFMLAMAIAFPLSLLAQRITFNGVGTASTKLKNPEFVIGQIVYDFVHISDTTQPDNPTKETMVLDFSNNYGKFYSQTFAASDSLFKADLEKQLKDQQSMGNLTLNARMREGSSDVFLTDKKTESVAEQKNFVGKAYLISDGKTTIDWDIQDSTKKIGNYTCQRAVGISKGRQYIVWFTTDLPYSYGPRRLNGLPGLILEAHDITNRIVYSFKQYNTVSGKEIGIPENAIASTEKEYTDMQTAFKANPNAFYSAASPVAPTAAAGGDMSKIKSINITSVSSVSGNNSKKKVVNFPIDLPK